MQVALKIYPKLLIVKSVDRPDKRFADAILSTFSLPLRCYNTASQSCITYSVYNQITQNRKNNVQYAFNNFHLFQPSPLDLMCTPTLTCLYLMPLRKRCTWTGQKMIKKAKIKLLRHKPAPKFKNVS